MKPRLHDLVSNQANLRAACEHLHASAHVIGEPRLSSYGPSFVLAAALCNAAQWRAVADYLRACRAFWDGEHDTWLDELSAGRVPDFAAHD